MPDALPDWPASMRAQRAADYLDVSKTYFLNAIARHLSPIRHSSSVILYLRRDIDGWLDRQAGGGPVTINAREAINGLVQQIQTGRKLRKSRPQAAG